MKHRRTFLLGLIGLALFSAQTAQARVALFRVQIQNCGTVCRAHWNVGACVTIGRCGQDWLVVSSGHHLGGGKFTGTAQVCTEKTQIPARLLGTTWPSGPDLSVWAIRPPPGWRACPLAKTVTSAGTPAGHIGLAGSQFRRHQTQIISKGQQLITSYPAIEGHSGGPIVSVDRWEVLGIIWGTDNARSYSVPADQVREVVRRFCPEFESPAAPSSPKEETKPAEIVVDYDRLADALLDRMSQDPRFRGPPGPPGDLGPMGLPGLPSPSTDLAAIREDLEELKQRRRWVVLKKDGQVIDKESYGPGDPIVLDVQRIINQGK